MQRNVEDLSFRLELETLYHSVPDVFAMIIKKDEPSARDLILQKRVGVNIQRVLKQLDEYTLEAVCVYVLSNLFNSGADSTLVRAATFIENLSYCIQYHYSVSSSRRMALGERLSMEESVSTEGEQPKLTSFGTKSSRKLKR